MWRITWTFGRNDVELLADVFPMRLKRLPQAPLFL